MTGYLIRRVVQMIVVVFFSAAASYALLNLAPGGPMAGLRQATQSSKFRITADDLARIRAYFELDLYLPVRFSRWLIGQPRGPIIIGGYEFFPNLPIGCRQPIEQNIQDAKGNYVVKTVGCSQYVYLRDLAARRTSRGVFFGDFGLSWTILRDQPVSDLIIGRLPKTLQLEGLAIIFSMLIGVPLGVYSAVKQYSRFDYFATFMAFLGSSMPTFFFGLILILAFSVIPKGAGLPYLPPGSSEAVRAWSIPILGEISAGSVADRVLHIILPVATLTMVQVSGWSRYVRASMLDVLRQDYVRTARAKGLMERVVIIKHALRNGLIPFITVAIFSIVNLFGGAVLTESVFSWPGMGRLFVLGLNSYDYPVAMAILFITAVLVVIATLLQDILYTMVDPRIRLS
jgi:peptide/nickel transport system permease protein